MKEQLLNYLICPKCKDELKIDKINKKNGEEIIDGILKCKCGCEYQIIEGLPRMFHNTSDGVKQSKAAFTRQWDIYGYEDEEDNTWLNLDEESRKKRFMTAFNIKPEDLKGKVILDAGCGNGRLSHTISDLGCEVVAIDISSGVEHASKFYNRKNLHYVQGDLMNIPFKENSFDYIWSAGVLHHTPNTKKAFDNLVPLVKKGGTLYVWVYGWPEGKMHLRAALWWNGRQFTMMWPKSIQNIFCIIYAPGKMFIDAICFKKQINARFARQKIRIFYDTMTPYMYNHRPSEVVDWFKEHNFKDIKMPIEDFKRFSGFGTSGIKQ